MPDRPKVRPEHVGVIVGHYLEDRDGGRCVRRQGEWLTWLCPRCGREAYHANTKWGTAGCYAPECPIEKSQKWFGLVAGFEGLSRENDVREIRRIGLEIVAEHEEKARRRAEAEARAKEEQVRVEREVREYAEAEQLRRRTAQDDTEQRLLDEHRAEQTRLQAEAERTRSDREHSERASRHEQALNRVLLARATVLLIELLLGVAFGAVLALAVYLGIGWLESFVATGRPTVETFGLPGVEPSRNDAWFVARARDVVDRILPGWFFLHRVPLAFSFGAVAGLILCWGLSRGRRTEHAFAEGEFAAIYRFGREDATRKPMQWVDGNDRRRDLWRGPILRFGRGSISLIVMPFRVAAGVATRLDMSQWPWLGLISGVSGAALTWVVVVWIFPEPFSWLLGGVATFLTFVCVMQIVRERTW